LDPLLVPKLGSLGRLLAPPPSFKKTATSVEGEEINGAECTANCRLDVFLVMSAHKEKKNTTYLTNKKNFLVYEMASRMVKGTVSRDFEYQLLVLTNNFLRQNTPHGTVFMV
jgi:hypothetical protein